MSKPTPTADPSPGYLDLGNGAGLWLYGDLLGPQAEVLFHELERSLPWQQPRLTLYGRQHPIPRLQCWMGDPEAEYRYSGLPLSPVPWHPGVQRICARVEALSGRVFNSSLVNLYRDGTDRMGWHSDNEPELGPAPWIASYSLGASRRFSLRRRGTTRTAHQLELAHDQLLLMSPAVQRDWQHALPATKRVKMPRINLTFRLVQPAAGTRLASGRGCSTPKPCT